MLHGDPPSQEDLERLRRFDTVVAADGGAEALRTADRIPDVIVGDLDSLSPDAFKWADAQGIPMERHPQRKDLTDGELALERVLEAAPDEVLILGGHGGRSAHFLQNLRLLERCHAAGADARMVGHGETLQVAAAGEALRFQAAGGHVLDVLALEPGTRITLDGTAYDHAGLDLRPDEARGVSNSIVSGSARVEVLAGKVLVVLERPPADGPGAP